MSIITFPWHCLVLRTILTVKKRRCGVIMVCSVPLWYESFYGECLRAAVCLVCSVSWLYNTQGWKYIKGWDTAVCWRLLVLRSHPDDLQTNLKIYSLCKNCWGSFLFLFFFFHLYFCSQLIFTPTWEEKDIRLYFRSGVSRNSNLTYGDALKVIFCLALSALMIYTSKQELNLSHPSASLSTFHVSGLRVKRNS